MTRLPLDSWEITGLEGAGYVANAVCAAPGCDLVVGERHHLWRRSFLAGDFWWVKLPDGAVIGNVVFLCQHHHQLITENKARIELVGNAFVWHDANGQNVLSWQPPVYADEHEFREHANHDSKTPGKNEGPKLEPVICEGCGRPLTPKVTTPKEKPRRRKSWSVWVPADEIEQGADLLDEYLERARTLFREAGLSYGEEDAARYYVLSTAISLFIAHADYILDAGG